MAAVAERHAREEMVGKSAVLTLKGKEAMRGTVSDVSKEGLCFIREMESKTGPVYYNWDDVAALDADEEAPAAARESERSRAEEQREMHRPAGVTVAEQRAIDKAEREGASHPEHPRRPRRPETPDKPAKPTERGANRTTQGGTKEEEEKAERLAKAGEPFDTEKDAPVREAPAVVPGARAVRNIPVSIQGEDTPNRSAQDEMTITPEGIQSISGRDIKDPGVSAAQKSEAEKKKGQ